MPTVATPCPRTEAEAVAATRKTAEPLTKEEIVAALTGTVISGLDKPLSANSARQIVSVMWSRIQVHRNRAYQLGYLHGRNNHNSVCEDLAAPYVKAEDVPTLFEVEA